jgi:hypothetical protein
LEKKRFDTASFLRSNRSKTLGFGFFTFIVVITLILGAIIPSVTAIIRLQSDISAKTERSEKLDVKIEALSDLSKEYDEYGYAFKDLPLVFPANNDFSLLLGYIDDISREHGYDLANVSFPEDSNLVGSSVFKYLQPQRVTLTVDGSQAYLVDYLSALEDLPMSPSVVGFNFTYSPDKNGVLSFNIQLETYRLENKLFYE